MTNSSKAVTAPPTGSSTVEAIAQGLSKGLAGMIAGKIGAAIISAIFPPSVPSYFDQVYQQISKIVQQEIEEDTIDQINGVIDATQLWVKNTYEVHKSEGDWTKQEMVDNLKVYIDAMNVQCLGTLQQPDYATAGFSVFMVAAGEQLSLIQEQAQVDPNQPDPSKSAYTDSYRSTANSYYDFALNTFIDIIITRASEVTITHNPEMVSGEVLIPATWSWSDSNTKESKSYQDNEKEKAYADLYAHTYQVLTQLVQSLNDPVETMLGWIQPTLEYDAAPLYNSNRNNQDGSASYDYSNPQDYVARLANSAWNAAGILGWMGGSDGKQADADVPIYRLMAANDAARVLLVFDYGTFEAQQAVGWTANAEGLGLLGYLWSDPSKIPVGSAIPVYALTAQGTDQARTRLVTSSADNESAQQAGWVASGLIGYLCSQG